MNIKKILVCGLAAMMAIGSTVLTVPAFENEQVVVEEIFDDYDVDYEGQATALHPIFVIEANSIGDGYIRVVENSENGNLHLKSHVFTQIYNSTPIETGYTFSLDIFQTQGNKNCAIFLRAPKKGTAAYYETDGYDAGSCCPTGIVLHCRPNALEVNIKSFDKTAMDYGFIGHNIFSFDLPEGVGFNNGEYTNIKAVDNGNEIMIYVEENLICRIALSDANKNGYRRIEVEDACYQKAVIYDATGTEVGSVENPTVQAVGATVGWATRVADMIVDNIYLSTHDLPETESESESESIAESTTESDTAHLESDSDTSTDETVADSTNATDSADATDSSVDETFSEIRNEPGCVSSLALGGLTSLLCAAFVLLKKKH